jgi:hypothetical protein
MPLLRRRKSDDQFRATGDTIAIRMMLVECLRQVALTKPDPEAFLRAIKDDLLARARHLRVLEDDHDNVVPTHVAAAISMVFDIATAKALSDGHAAGAAKAAADGSDSGNTGGSP